MATQKTKKYLKQQWDTLLWIIAAFAVLYLSEFASNVLFNPRVKRSWQLVSFISFAVAIYCIINLIRRGPRFKLTDWDSSPIPTIGFIAGVIGIISFTFSMWPVWRYWNLLIVPILFMGFISAVSML